MHDRGAVWGRYLTIGALLFGLFPVTDAIAAIDGPAYVVKDLTNGSEPGAASNPSAFFDLGEVAVFTARDAAHGVELWRSDGTSAGTSLVKDIAAGPGDGVLGAARAASHGVLYFPGFGGLWASDGSAVGTRLVAPLEASRLVADGDRLYATGPLGTGFGLWRVDLPSGATTLLHAFGYADIEPSLTLLGARLFFAGFDDDQDEGLWMSDGTPAGTRVVRQVRLANREGGNEHTELFAVGGQVFFTARDGAGWELWRSDGSEAGTYRVRDINPGPAHGVHFNDYWEAAQPFFAGLDGALLFMADDGEHGLELWRSDGTEAGTMRLTDVAGSRGLDGTEGDDDASDAAQSTIRMLPFDGRLFFTARVGGGLALWASDGTAAGTAEVMPLTADWGRVGAAAVGATRVFLAVSSQNGDRLWTSDGTAIGTEPIAALTATELAPALGGVMFAADQRATGNEPWSSDGTAPGTRLLADLVRGVPGLAPQQLADVAGTLFFSADDGVHGRELWRSDGSDGGTTLVADLAPGDASADPEELHASGATLYFTANVSPYGRQLWRSDGTAAGTQLVRDVAADGDGFPFGPVADGRGGIYFFTPGLDGYDLWHSDGGADGTRRVHELQWSGYEPPALLDDGLLFAAADAAHSVELWRTDGTPVGTALVADLLPGPVGSGPNGLTRVGDAVLFFASDGTTSASLWRSDGSAAGTKRVATIGQVIGRPLVTAGATMLFPAFGEHGYRIWQSDGTAAGTAPASNAWQTSQPQLAAVGDLGFFLESGRGREVVARIGCADLLEMSSAFGSLFSLSGLGDRLLFAGRGDDRVLDLWTSDGTPSGTFSVDSLPPPADGQFSGTYPQFVRSGATVYFSSRQGDAGSELWGLPVSALPLVDQAPCPPRPTPTPPPNRPMPRPFACPSGSFCTVLELDRVDAHPGTRVTFGATLHASDAPIAGIQNDITFPAGITVLPNQAGHPDCVVEADIDKPHTSFSFQPPGCATSGLCTGMRALVLSVLNVDPIPDGARLYTCTAEVAPDLSAGEYPLALSAMLASDPDGIAITLEGIDGVVSVAAESDTNPIGGGAAAGGGCQTAPAASSAWPLAALVAALLLAPRHTARSASLLRRSPGCGSLEGAAPSAPVA